ncbi:MAG: SusC/RagA family protein, partial [Candidatus Amulumruptor sp.]|nr:SusC/RagA family protein [Candidatus Amulumruptor sp.]
YNLIQYQTTNWPNTIGLDAMLINRGEVRNQGVEIQLGWNDRINRDWSYFVNGNFSWLKNKVTDTGVKNADGEAGVWTGGGEFRSIIPYVYQTAEGQPLGSFYLIKTDGIFQSDAEAQAYTGPDGSPIQPNAKAGDLKFVDFNGDGKIDSSDRQYCGNSMPKTTYAFSLGATWRELSVSAMFQGVGGAQAFYAGKSVILNANAGNFNRSAEILNAWRPDNTVSNIPRLSRTDNNGNFTTPSDWYLEDASYLRMKNLTVNYDLTRLVRKWAHLNSRASSLNVYFSAENLFTITDYSGVDPECGGYDALKYPVSRTFSFGINLKY